MYCLHINSIIRLNYTTTHNNMEKNKYMYTNREKTQNHNFTGREGRTNCDHYRIVQETPTTTTPTHTTLSYIDITITISPTAIKTDIQHYLCC